MCSTLQALSALTQAAASSLQLTTTAIWTGVVATLALSKIPLDAALIATSAAASVLQAGINWAHPGGLPAAQRHGQLTRLALQAVGATVERAARLAASGASRAAAVLGGQGGRGEKVMEGGYGVWPVQGG